ncbi:MAG: hypothetical protein LBR51_03425 [Bacteroidales bacterium]|jgi:hypothetical protein|nr:hypothetical protein [Bacteroidales bacterium]
MFKPAIKYIAIFFLLVIYINRGLFVVPVEIENNGKQEVNTLLEWALEILTGTSNYIDEDGDSQANYNFAKNIQPVISEQIAQTLDFLKTSQRIIKIFTPTNETIPHLPVLGQIDHPPQI